MSIERIALIGFGEVGRTLGQDLAGRDVTVFDILFDDEHSIPSRSIESSSCRRCETSTAAARNRDLVISAVTASQSVRAAKSVASALRPGTWFFDLNSVAPRTRRETANIIERAGGRYVEAAVMAPIAPQRIRTQMLLGGPSAREFEAEIRTAGFAGAEAYSDRLGPASAAKLCRSVIIKGLESLFTEALLAARRHEVDATVLASLDNLLRDVDWSEFARYLISRSLEHGERRAAEMRAAAETVADAGIEPLMSTACAERQAIAAGFTRALGADNLGELLDAILEARTRRRGSRTT